MATQAVKFLQHKSGDAGYFVMIEAGRIDQAHHNGEATKALSETLAFDKAIEEVNRPRAGDPDKYGSAGDEPGGHRGHSRHSDCRPRSYYVHRRIHWQVP